MRHYYGKLQVEKIDQLNIAEASAMGWIFLTTKNPFSDSEIGLKMG